MLRLLSALALFGCAWSLDRSEFHYNSPFEICCSLCGMPLQIDCSLFSAAVIHLCILVMYRGRCIVSISLLFGGFSGVLHYWTLFVRVGF